MYPKDFPTAQALEIVSIVRKNEVKTKVNIFAYDLRYLQGYAQKTFIGEPTATTPTIPDFTTFSAKPDNFDAIGELEKLCATDNQLTSQSLIPWHMILKWALEELIQLIPA